MTVWQRDFLSYSETHLGPASIVQHEPKENTNYTMWATFEEQARNTIKNNDECTTAVQVGWYATKPCFGRMGAKRKKDCAP